MAGKQCLNFIEQPWCSHCSKIDMMISFGFPWKATVSDNSLEQAWTTWGHWATLSSVATSTRVGIRSHAFSCSHDWCLGWLSSLLRPTMSHLSIKSWTLSMRSAMFSVPPRLLFSHHQFIFVIDHCVHFFFPPRFFHVNHVPNTKSEGANAKSHHILVGPSIKLKIDCSEDTWSL